MKKINRHLYLQIREIIPVGHTLINKIMAVADINNVLDILETNLPNKIKREYINNLGLDDPTADKIWEAYQGDMWVKSEIYGKNRELI